MEYPTPTFRSTAHAQGWRDVEVHVVTELYADRHIGQQDIRRIGEKLLLLSGPRYHLTTSRITSQFTNTEISDNL